MVLKLTATQGSLWRWYGGRVLGRQSASLGSSPDRHKTTKIVELNWPRLEGRAVESTRQSRSRSSRSGRRRPLRSKGSTTNQPLNEKKLCHSPVWRAEWVMAARKSYFSTRYLAITGVMTDWPRLWARNLDILGNFLAPRHFLDLRLSLLAIFPINNFPDYSFLKTVSPGNCTFFSIVSVPFTHSPEAVFYFNIHRPSLLEPNLNI